MPPSISGNVVVVTYLRIQDAPNPEVPEAHRRNRACTATHVVDEIIDAGGTAIEVELDLTDDASAEVLFRAADAAVEVDPPLVHIGLPEEVADVIIYLVSGHARLITGTIIHLR